MAISISLLWNWNQCPLEFCLSRPVVWREKVCSVEWLGQMFLVKKMQYLLCYDYNHGCPFNHFENVCITLWHAALSLCHHHTRLSAVNFDGRADMFYPQKLNYTIHFMLPHLQCHFHRISTYPQKNSDWLLYILPPLSVLLPTKKIRCAINT